jgi:hypothetical protein
MIQSFGSAFAAAGVSDGNTEEIRGQAAVVSKTMELMQILENCVGRTSLLKQLLVSVKTLVSIASD